MSPLRPARAIAPVLVLATTALAGCGSTQTHAAEPSRPLTAADYFPLTDHAAWSFNVDTGIEGAEPVLTVMHVVRATPPVYIVRVDQQDALYRVESDGVTRNGTYVIKDPLRPGTRWTGIGGTPYHIEAVGQTRQAASGETFHDCVEVVSGGANQPTTVTYFAPRVGPVEVSAEQTSSRGFAVEVHSLLRGYTLTGDL